MIIGDINILHIFSRDGAVFILTDEQDNRIQIPASEVPENKSPGDKIEVFILTEDDATIYAPTALVDDFAFLEIKIINEFGLFLDWGLSKDLFVPKRNLRKDQYREGEKICICVELDYKETSLVGTTYFNEHFEKDISALEENQKVELLIYEETDLGYKVIINNTYDGVIYRSEVYQKVKVGETVQGFIKKIREDELIDASLQPQGFRAANDLNEQLIIDALEKNGGSLPLHDKSSPEDIYSTLGISKKSFKKGIGTLYRNKVIIISDKGINFPD